MKRGVVVPVLIISAVWIGTSNIGKCENAAVQPGAPAAPTKDEPGVLTNDSIIKMAEAGLSDVVIVNMVSSQPGRYSLTPDDVIAMKKAGVSENAISAMLKRSAAAPATPVAVPPEVANASITEVGVYMRTKDAWLQMMPEVVNWKTGGVIKSHVTVGIVKGDVNGRLNGETSRYSTFTPVGFLIYVPEGVEITEYQLMRLRQHHDSREFRTVTGGVFHVSGGATRDTLPFEYKKTATRTYLVILSDDLGPGEYGFLSPGAALASHASAQLGKMYTFRVAE
ncbi:MAG TPA: hypothetical protein VIX19_17415 [Terriglobales bacterium]